jgi:hypothetical protein
VYGYRGHQCRDNVHVTHTGELVYAVAALVVLQVDGYMPCVDDSLHYI